MSTLLASLVARFNVLPVKAVAAVVLVVGLLFMFYREGRHAADEAAAVELAKHNAAVAAKYMRDVEAAEDAAARALARADDLAKQVTQLKEQVAHVAKGNASPGVDAAVHGVRGKNAVP